MYLASKESRWNATTRDRAFLASYDAERYDRPSVAVDVACSRSAMGPSGRCRPPAGSIRPRGSWALPGCSSRSASRSMPQPPALPDKAGVADVFTEQLFTFGDRS
jgi:hypothetical protein